MNLYPDGIQKFFIFAGQGPRIFFKIFIFNISKGSSLLSPPQQYFIFFIFWHVEYEFNKVFMKSKNVLCILIKSISFY